ncbi:MAG TPA: hypothetical protein VGN88_02170, partial [Phycisphaerae bacterium]
MSDSPSPVSPITTRPSAAPSSINPPLVAVTAVPRLATVTGIQWENILDFLHVFRSFRLAINPAKLLMALMALIAIYTAGRLFDLAWGRQAYPAEVQQYAEGTNLTADEAQSARISALLGLLAADNELSLDERVQLKADPAQAIAILKKYYKDQFEKDIASTTSQEARRRAAAKLMDNMTKLQQVSGQGIFQTFMIFEIDEFNQLVDNTLSVIRVSPARPVASSDGTPSGESLGQGIVSRESGGLWRSDTLVGSILNIAVAGPHWLFTGAAPMQWRPANADTWGGWLRMVGYRGMYLFSVALLALFTLLMIALVGGCICRLSALELAGIERAPLKEVFTFAIKRVGIFIKAPLAPFIILLAIGLIMALVAMAG